jgi:hypothetical protein
LKQPKRSGRKKNRLFWFWLICGSASQRWQYAPAEISKTWRLTNQNHAAKAGIEVDVLDLSGSPSSYNLNIHPRKGKVRQLPCLCAITGRAVVTPTMRRAGAVTGWLIYGALDSCARYHYYFDVYWYQAPSPLKLKD